MYSLLVVPEVATEDVSIALFLLSTQIPSGTLGSGGGYGDLLSCSHEILKGLVWTAQH